jgi:hypothetical protein
MPLRFVGRESRDGSFLHRRRIGKPTPWASRNPRNAGAAAAALAGAALGALAFAVAFIADRRRAGRFLLSVSVVARRKWRSIWRAQTNFIALG